MFDWFWRFLSFLNLYEHISGSIIFLGLENAGKTTLLGKLKTGRIQQFEPTTSVNREDIKVGSCTFSATDVGGHEPARALWKTYCLTVNGIVFVLDAAHDGKFQIASKELNRLLTDDDLKNVPIVIMANKVDKECKYSEEMIKTFFNLHPLLTGKHNKRGTRRPVELFMCSIKNEFNVAESLEWLAKQI
jgi:GTP-binding protein SAR1